VLLNVDHSRSAASVLHLCDRLRNLVVPLRI